MIKTCNFCLDYDDLYNLPTKFSTVPLCTSKVFISRSCPILVLATVLGRPRHTDAKNDVKNYQGPTTSQENVIRKYLNFHRKFF